MKTQRKKPSETQEVETIDDTVIQQHTSKEGGIVKIERKYMESFILQEVLC